MTGKQREVGQYRVGHYKPWMKIRVCENSPNQALFLPLSHSTYVLCQPLFPWANLLSGSKH